MVRAPAADDLAYVHERYMGRLFRGEFRADTREGILSVIDRVVQAGADGILLAELSCRCSSGVRATPGCRFSLPPAFMSGGR
jgi:hypothetical protein